MKMIFNSPEGKAIFIHIPKTGGNTIQKHIFDKGDSMDEMKISGHQDGKDRFEVRGRFTSKKHMKLSEYFEYEQLRSFEIFTCIRNSLDRLVSFYFSPHRHVKRNKITGEISYPEKVDFDIDEFAEMIEKIPTMIKILSIPSNHDIPCISSTRIPSKVKIIRTENLKLDASALLDLEINNSSNVSPYRDSSKKAKSDPAVQKLIFNSKHQEDQDFFYGANINLN
ncbi:sulfotransferase family protein [Synechococcus sp. A15-62]|uniref:sulfotransferase family 2 domain-containing protein n=1 Tax=Synechococcus sp. A15-62 TaxID=1050657 RepID=UPI001644E35A|nr:sulfotransferase family 2 domain-containing protein [Synechococcus sp. A15-62]QNJ00961.1 sulfotransferase family protein [Synechococcus sp. A15-62]